MQIYFGFVPNFDAINPRNGGSMPPDQWNILFLATYGNESLEKNNGFVDCLCGTPNCTVGVACPNCDEVVA